MDDKTKKWKRQEKNLARRTNGSQQSGSGNGPWRKGDVRLEDYLIEAKRTDRASWTFKASEWETIRHHALMEGRTPAIHLELGGRSFYIIEEGDL